VHSASKRVEADAVTSELTILNAMFVIAFLRLARNKAELART
jgi:hypothetical protein